MRYIISAFLFLTFSCTRLDISSVSRQYQQQGDSASLRRLARLILPATSRDKVRELLGPPSQYPGASDSRDIYISTSSHHTGYILLSIDYDTNGLVRSTGFGQVDE